MVSQVTEVTSTLTDPVRAVTVAATISLPTTPDPPTVPAPVVSQPPALSAPDPMTAATPNDGLPGGIFKFSRTAGGNAIVDLGDENLKQDQFAAMLMEYNNTIPTAPTPQAAVSRRNATPVLYNEPSDYAQNDANFYSAMVDFDPFMSSSTDIGDFFDFQAASLQSPGL